MKSKVSFYAAVGFFVVALVCVTVVDWWAANIVALVALTLGIICGAGSFALRLPRSTHAEADEMLRDIK